MRDSMRIGWAGHAASIVKPRNAQKVLDQNPENTGLF
jgi:hypothetical protein